ncbi:aromatic ring-hydroxylating oxygenase subunit alpha [Paraburkholderia silvatlantica]|uniref:Phenylpropionate dioxygenase-like ring-hydroxylating dioxygenase large terminal subunit n=1 Tax=Paraburkholderia silvatlantica TaxID=321895 RepID=A0A2U1A9V0_9BURK|nr:aromatic ring-hydroxylating dioxygenase subunit alpha [Paraburkholderia silvatlantica]MBB2930638.1 phenylpropionate dioxygenase-like ring-hydroxylating dioxygenase large terminal subunit [Paraburkholderia silvatlantica]PVY30439.1 phenylpropionate dioxygenase-like ring-hydroxylating dioxygenase large terminal subunit [Paraburkholderia silvatlantica]PXW36824.1 phenylpropionate dioxygenase-like ring-hydroxylating dioxygenase large terminal subunit [Paraburkholderia silvatlantica]PYE21165.1 phen
MSDILQPPCQIIDTSALHTRVEPDRVLPSLYNDPALFEAELDRIFYRTWIWVAHESELPNPGDFRTTVIGRQPVIVVRDRDGSVNVLENRCRHRAATVCEQHKGNARGFTCPYHSWSYGLDGALRALPYGDGYEGIADKHDLPLRRLRVGIYQGLIFASFNDAVEPLEDFLGGAKPWIDLFMKQGAGYPVKMNGEHRFRFKGNWKIQLENTTDLYHFPVVHKSWMKTIDDQTAASITSFMTSENAFCRSLGNGHSVAVLMPELIDLDDDNGAPLPVRHEALAASLAKSYPPDEVRRIVRSLMGVGFNVNLFPNLALSMSFFRVLRPVSVDETEIRHVALAMDGGPDEANRVRLRVHEHFQGPLGFGSPDDAEAWERVQRGSHAGPDVPILVNRGLNRETTAANGEKTAHATDETGMRAAYAKWQQMMEPQS